MTNGTQEPFAVRRRQPHEPAPTRQPRAYTSEEDILAAIRRWARRYGEPPTMVDWEPARARRYGQDWRADRFESDDWPSVGMVRGRFGTFSAAVARAGLAARRPPSRLRAHISDSSAVLEAIVEWTRRYGEVPAMADWDPVRARRLGQDWRIARYNGGDWPSTRTVLNHFGSFGNAIAAAGLLPRPRSATPDERGRRRAANRLRVAERSAAGARTGAEALAERVRALSAARASGDPVALHASLIDVAAAALSWAEATAIDGDPR